jgi:hypothetical protein
MSAKHKLNSAHFLGALLLASLAGGLAGSWSVFLVALAGLLLAGIVAGDIRR